MNPQDRRWITAREASELLNVSLKGIYKAVASKRIPGAKVSGIGLRVDRLGLDRMLEGDQTAHEQSPDRRGRR